jgi:hypothetical protein
MRTLLLTLCAAAALGATGASTHNSGPYVDSQGGVWLELPNPADYPSAAAFDALFAREVFTTRDGHRFQLDRPLTDAELAVARVNQQIRRQFRNAQGSGNHVRASVSTNNPVDEEFRGLFANTMALKNYVTGEVATADASMNSQWGIDIVPTKGAAWDSNDTADIVQLLDESYREHGLDGMDMMNAWSADSTPGGAIGVAYIGLPRLLVKKYQSFEGNILEHEIGHTYTLQHCCDGNCCMQAALDPGALGGFHNYNEGCSGQNHSSVMNNQKNRY